ncbi:two-partner secretion domain-containing protein [Neisseria chenwenguii]|uniref:two-partner secretion domain-containing protein n=1 Tax=Neisseria chenwenguii TaxID=1853278 RepID=UPI000F50238F|nr:filamentous hemagglutinin N-terminal domain-containing protein [Neisseria chenwenguii]
MNRNLYKIIFNPHRNSLMAVPETASAAGRSAGRRTSRRSPRMPNLRLCTAAFFTSAALGSAGFAAAADICTDRSAAAHEQATVLLSANGLPQANIQTPNGAGVSLNRFSRFDVDGRGALFNNSRTDVQTQLGGWIQGNPWLARGEARVIVNQIESANPSLLNGYIEVGGRRAEAVMANPAGISVSGGFINAAGVTLAGGRPVWKDGAIDGFAHSGGIRIGGAGLDTADADCTRILARGVQTDAGIWAKNLTVAAGSRTDAAGGRVGDSTVPSGYTAIDTGRLGGMYADKITLLSHEKGAVIRNAGQLFARAGNVSVKRRRLDR